MALGMKSQKIRTSKQHVKNQGGGGWGEGEEVTPKKYSRTYTKWSSEDTKLVNSYFQKYIVDTQTNGSLPPKCEILKFLSMHDILQGHENIYQLVRTKVFNEKKKFRNCFNGL